MRKWVRKPAVVIASFFSGLLTAIKLISDWIGRSTVAEDADALAIKMDNLIAFVSDQPTFLFYGVTVGFLLLSLALAYKPEIAHALGMGAADEPTVIVGTKVILPAPKQIMSGHCKFSTERPQDSDRVIATGAPPHSVTNIRYRVTATDGAEMVLAGLSPKIAIREVGSTDGPILEGTGFAEAQLNRHSQFEIFSTCEDLEEEPWVHIELWLVGWITT